MSLSKKDLKNLEKDLLKRSAEANAMTIDVSVGSYEEFRDGYRFMSRLAVFTFFLSTLINFFSAYFILTKESSKTYVTSRDGKIEIINPIAKSESEMESIKRYSQSNNRSILILRDRLNPRDNNE